MRVGIAAAKAGSVKGIERSVPTAVPSAARGSLFYDPKVRGLVYQVALVAIVASYADEHYDAHTVDLRAAFERGLYGHSG